MTTTAKMGSAGCNKTRDPHNVSMRAEAHRELDDLLNLGEAGEQYGVMSVDVFFAAGIIERVRTRLERSIKSARGD